MTGSSSTSNELNIFSLQGYKPKFKFHQDSLKAQTKSESRDTRETNRDENKSRILEGTTEFHEKH